MCFGGTKLDSMHCSSRALGVLFCCEPQQGNHHRAGVVSRGPLCQAPPQPMQWSTAVLLFILNMAFTSDAYTSMKGLAAMGNQPGNSTAPALTYWHMWSDAQGVSHLTECKLTNFSKVNFLPPSPPLWLDTYSDPSKVLFLNAPVGWVGPWHKDPEPQLVLFLSGQGTWTAMDGTNHTFNPGDIYFGNDQASLKGHVSRQVGPVPMNCVLLQFSSWSTTNHHPCWLV